MFKESGKQCLSAGIIFIVFLGITILFFPSAYADSLQGRLNYHITMAKGAAIDDITGHKVGIGAARGLTSFDSGEIATLYGVFTFDYINGTGKFQSYLTHTFSDGSTLVWYIDNGDTTALEGGKISRITAQFSIVEGTGRFAGAKGSGVWTGKRLTPLSSGADCYADFNVTYTSE